MPLFVLVQFLRVDLGETAERGMSRQRVLRVVDDETDERSIAQALKKGPLAVPKRSAIASVVASSSSSASSVSSAAATHFGSTQHKLSQLSKAPKKRC